MSSYISAVKRVERYVLKSTDVTIHTTTRTYNDATVIPLTTFVGVKPQILETLQGSFRMGGFEKEVLVLSADDPSVTYAYGTSTTSLTLYTPKGTYPNLASAQSALAGKEILYEVATPVFIPYEDFDQYGIECEGLLVSHDDYTSVNYTGDLVPNVELTYPRNIGACVDGLSQAMGNVFDMATGIYNTIEQDCQDWIPTLTWTGTPPLTPIVVAKYKQIGSTVNFNLSITSTDGNGSSQLTITLPIAPKVNSTTIPLNAQEKVNTTWTNPLAYILDSGSLIQFRSFSTATDNVALEVLVSGSYEVV